MVYRQSVVGDKHIATIDVDQDHEPIEVRETNRDGEVFIALIQGDSFNESEVLIPANRLRRTVNVLNSLVSSYGQAL